ncbi:MAG: hypothetical protein ACOZAN_00830 [Patescibacteria group bacterium]
MKERIEQCLVAIKEIVDPKDKNRVGSPELGEAERIGQLRLFVNELIIAMFDSIRELEKMEGSQEIDWQITMDMAHEDKVNFFIRWFVEEGNAIIFFRMLNDILEDENSIMVIATILGTRTRNNSIQVTN